jgi:transmembrane sensor
MTKEEFQDLLQRYTAGKCSSDEAKEVDRWFANISVDDRELQAWEIAEINQQMHAKLSEALPSAKKNRPEHNRSILFLKVAASLIAIAVFTYLIFSMGSSLPSASHAYMTTEGHEVEHKNFSNDILLVQLPDSSTVTLQPNAEISYANNWVGEKREVRLVGEAFFDVVKDSKRPFYVYGGEIVTKVLGTSFSVNAKRDAQSIQVAVRTGKVSVYEGRTQMNRAEKSKDHSGVVLTPNEKVEFFVNDKHWVTSLVEEPKPFPAINKAVEFVYSSAPLKDIIVSIEKAYAIDVVIESESLNNCMFTGDVSAMELYDMLHVICKTTGNSYEVKGTKILITGTGCD